MAIEAATEVQIFALRDAAVKLDKNETFNRVVSGNYGYSDDAKGFVASATEIAELNALVTALKAAADAVDAAV